jgi:hypothetical protein
VAAVYFRRVPSPRSRWFARLGRAHSYEVWRDDGPVAMTGRQLDSLLDASRFPADYWVAVEAADNAFEEGDVDAWIESGSGRRVVAPPRAAE